MMHFINGAVLAMGSSPAASIAAKATLAAALGIVGAWLARGSSAAVRHVVLVAAFSVLLPIAAALVAIGREKNLDRA